MGQPHQEQDPSCFPPFGSQSFSQAGPFSKDQNPSLKAFVLHNSSALHNPLLAVLKKTPQLILNDDERA